MWLLLLAPALAFEVPAFDPAQHTYVEPPSTAFDASAAEAAARAAERPVYTVVFDKVIDGRIEDFHESETEDAIEAVWEAWKTADGFPADTAILTVLALDDREVRLRMGYQWDADLGLAGPALLPIIDRHFMPRARAGDLEGGLGLLVTGADQAVDAAIAERAAAAEAAIRRAAQQAELEKLQAEQAALKAAQQRARAEARAEFAEWVWGVLLPGAALALGVGIVFTLLLVSWLLTRRARRRFDEALRARTEALEHAQGRLAELNLDVSARDQVVALKVKGPVTQALVDEVEAAVNRLHDGLAALEGRTAELAARRPGMGLSPRPWAALRRALDAPFEQDIGEVPGRLFDTPTQVVTIDPVQTMAELAESFDEARLVWTRVLDAVDASMRRAEDDLLLADLEALQSALEQAELPQTWITDHPLAEDPRAAWAELDALRTADPAAYLDALEDAIEAHDGVADRVGALTAIRADVAAAWTAADAVDMPDTVARDPAWDPVDLEWRCRTAEANVEELLVAGHDWPATRRAAATLLDDLGRLLEVRTAVKEAADTIDGAIASAEGQIASLDTQLATVRADLRGLLKDHVPQRLREAFRELTEAHVDADEARAALEQARGERDAGAHIAAMLHVRLAVTERSEALADLKELAELVQVAETTRSEALAMREALDNHRRTQAAAAARAGSYGRGALRAGDTRRRELGEWTGPGDWLERLADARGVLTAWQEGVHEATRKHEAAVRARERAAAAAARAAAKQRAARRSSSGSSYRSSSSRSSFGSSRSSFGSSRSSSRSSGRSFSSSSRSAGRSTSSSRRSAGRKF